MTDGSSDRWQLVFRIPYNTRELECCERSSLRAYLGSGMSAYYRYHHGERKLTPQQQQEILEIVKRFSPKEDATFDHYELAWDF